MKVAQGFIANICLTVIGINWFKNLDLGEERLPNKALYMHVPCTFKLIQCLLFLIAPLKGALRRYSY